MPLTILTAYKKIGGSKMVYKCTGCPFAHNNRRVVEAHLQMNHRPKGPEKESSDD
jgi:hypothetical protein